MSKIHLSESAETTAAVAMLFENGPPILVEVRFPNMGTSPNLYLCEEEEQLDQILDRLGPGVDVFVNSVWDLKNVKEAVRLKK